MLVAATVCIVIGVGSILSGVFFFFPMGDWREGVMFVTIGIGLLLFGVFVYRGVARDRKFMKKAYANDFFLVDEAGERFDNVFDFQSYLAYIGAEGVWFCRKAKDDIIAAELVCLIDEQKFILQTVLSEESVDAAPDEENRYQFMLKSYYYDDTTRLVQVYDGAHRVVVGTGRYAGFWVERSAFERWRADTWQAHIGTQDANDTKKIYKN